MASDGRRHVLAIGGIGGPLAAPVAGLPLLIAHAVELAGRPAPRVCLLNTGMGDHPQVLVRLYSVLSATPARGTHLELFPMPNVPEPEDLLLSQDVLFVGAGSAADMVAVWRGHALATTVPAAP